MRLRLDAQRGVALAAAATTLVASLVTLRAQQGAGASASAPAKPTVPVSANSVTANPDAYYGESVTMTAAVEQIFSRSAFAVGQRTIGGAAQRVTKTLGTDVLVLAPTLQAPVDLNAYVTVMGELVRFDPAEIARKAKGYTLDLAPDIVAKYGGRPAVLATAVINKAMVDLAKRPPPPLTADDEALSKVMKRVGPAFAALRTAVTASNAETTGQQAAVLKQGFTETEAFWKSKGKADAATWAHDARTQAEAIERAAAAGKWDDLKAPSATLGQACLTCHTAYRERVDDGSYRIKTGSR